MDIKKEIRKRKFLSKAQTIATIAKDVINTAVHISPPYSVKDIVMVGSQLASSVYSARTVPDDIIEDTVVLYMGPIERDIMAVISKLPGSYTYPLKGWGSECHRMVTDLGGDLYLQTHVDSNYYDVQIPRHQDPDKTLKALGYHVWNAKGKNLVITGTTTRGRDGISVIPDVLVETKESGRAKELYEKQKKFIDKGLSRSILLVGSPGTGKSHCVRQVGQKMGTTLRIRAQGFSSIPDIGTILKTLNPDCLIIDDFDRISTPSGVLDSFEEIRATTKLFLATVNDKTKLDSACLRPGRFDEVIEFEKLDEEILEHLLKNFSPAIKDVLKQMPIAYVDEYRRIMKVLGEDPDHEILIGLINRVNESRGLVEDPEPDSKNALKTFEEFLNENP